MTIEIKRINEALQKEGFLQTDAPQPIEKVHFPVYISANEFGFIKALELVEKISTREGGVYLGVSGMQNWDYIVRQKPQLALLADFNPKEVAFNKQMLEIIHESKTASDFESKAILQITTDFTKDSGSYEVNRRYGIDVNNRNFTILESLINEIKEIVRREDGPLANKNFSFFQQMVREGRVVALSLDLTDPKRITRLSEIIHSNGLTFSFLYLSNVYDYFEHDKERSASFKTAVNALKEKETLIVDTTLCRSIWMLKTYLVWGEDPYTSHPYDPDIVRGWHEVDRASYYTLSLSSQDDGKYQTAQEGVKLSKWIDLN